MNREQKALASILERLEARVAVGAAVPHFGTPDSDAIVASIALLRRAFVQGRAILELSQGSDPSAAVPNLRSLCEAYAEFVHLLTGTPDEVVVKAQTAYLFALKEMRDFQRRSDANGPDYLKVATEFLAKAEAAPAAAAHALAARRFWSKKGRAELLETALASWPDGRGGTLPPALGRQLYKLLSWDDHHVMAMFLSLDLNSQSPTIGRVKAQDAPADPERFIPLVAFGALTRMSTDFESHVAAHEKRAS